MASLQATRLLTPRSASPLLRRTARPLRAPASSPFSTAVLPSALARPSPSPRPIPKRVRILSPARRPLATSASSSSSEIDPTSTPTPPAAVDWSTSYHGIAAAPFPNEVSSILRRPLNPADVEIKPDGILYLPEIKYRNVLFEAFGAGGWGMVPRGPVEVGERIVTREWALVVQGRFVSQAQGENNYFSKEQIPRAVEAVKSNALMRCCKDLGVAWELWDKKFVRTYKAAYAHEVWVEHVVTKKRVKIWLKKAEKVEFPFKLAPMAASNSSSAAPARTTPVAGRAPPARAVPAARAGAA